MEADKEEMDPPKKKRQRWEENDDLELIEVWAEYEHDLRKSKRNSHIYAQMAKKMGDRFTAQEVHSKIKNLGSRYRCERKLIGPSGGSPSSWVHYGRVHQIIGSNAANNNNIMESLSFESTSRSSPPRSSTVPTFNFEEIECSLASLPSPSSSDSQSTFSFQPISPPLASPVDNSSQLPETSQRSSVSPRSSTSKKTQKNNHEVLSAVLHQGELQLQLMQNLSKAFTSFLDQQEASENKFLEVFNKMADK